MGPAPGVSAMFGRTRRRAIYLGTALATIAMFAGLSLAAAVIPAPITQTQQQATGVVVDTRNVTGLWYGGGGTGIGGNPVGSHGFVPVHLAAGYNVVCLSYYTCTWGNITLFVQIDFDKTLGGGQAVLFDTYLSSFPTAQRTSGELLQPTTPVSGEVLFEWDLGGDTSFGNASMVFETCPTGGGTCWQ